MQGNSKQNGLLVILAVIWIFVVTGLYYVFHKPVAPHQVLLWLSILWSVLVAGWIVSISAGLGGYILRNIFHLSDSGFVLSPALGLGVFGILVIILGVIQFQFRILLIAMLIICTILLRTHVRLWYGQLTLELRQFKIINRMDAILAGMAIIMASLSLLPALAPPIQFDALTYHLALPRLYLLNGGISSQVDWIRAGMPQLGEMVYTLALAFGPDTSPAVTGWMVAVLSLLGLSVWMAVKTSTRVGLVSALSLLGGLSIALSMGWGYVDWFNLMFGLCAVICVAKWIETPALRWIILVGIFCGFSMGSKYTGGIIFACAFFWLVINGSLRKQFVWKELVILSASFLITFSPWMIKNTIFTGDPLAPFGLPFLSRPDIHREMMRITPPFGNWMDIFLLPLRATYLGVEGGFGYSHDIGPLLLILSPLSILLIFKKGEHQNLLSAAWIMSLTGLIIWAVGNQLDALLIQSRLYYVLFPIFAVLAGFGYSAIQNRSAGGVRLVRFVDVVLILVLSLAVIQMWTKVQNKGTVTYLAGGLDRSAYLEQNLGWYARAVEMVKQSGQKTLMIYETRPYGCLPDCTPDEILDRWYAASVEQGGCDAVLLSWRATGYKQLLVNQAGIGYFRGVNDPHHHIKDLDALESCLSKLPRIQNLNEYQLYSLE